MTESEESNTWDAKMDTRSEEEPEQTSGFHWGKLAFIILIPLAIITGIGKFLYSLSTWVYNPNAGK